MQRLIDGPAQTARDYLEEASLPQVTPEEREHKLRNASDELHRAISLQPEGSMMRAYACINLAVVQRLLGDTGSSVLQARRAVDAAAAHVITALEAIKKGKGARSRDLKVSAATALAWPAAARAAVKYRSLSQGLPAVWGEYGEIQRAASALCGGGDAEVQQCAERISVTVEELKLGKVVNKLAAANT